jgi:serine O-acetyltransferase
MSLKELFYLISRDFARFEETFRLRHQRYSKIKVILESIFFKAGFQAVVTYRFSHWFYHKRCTYISWFLSRINIWSTGAEIEFNAEIGPGLFISHPVGIVIGRGTKIGVGATIFQGVTFVVSSWHPDSITKFPIVGDSCWFFSHASVLGGITIGNDCIVAANSVVSKDMPDGSLAVGVPAVIHPVKGREKINSWKEAF